MKSSKHTLVAFYQNLGKLFYAIASVDNNVKEEEFLKLQEIVKRDWLSIDLIDNMHDIEPGNLIINTFSWLRNDNEYDAETCFNSFLKFKKEKEYLFSSKINSLILKTAGAIAASYSGTNKSELIMTAKLNLELKK
jgi:hypothetical protein